MSVVMHPGGHGELNLDEATAALQGFLESGGTKSQFKHLFRISSLNP
jgi:hypothetical protein